MHSPTYPSTRLSTLFNRTGMRYEVALDVLGAMIAHYAEAIARERDRLEADEIVIAFLRHHQTGLRNRQTNLGPRDTIAIEAILCQVDLGRGREPSPVNFPPTRRTLSHDVGRPWHFPTAIAPPAASSHVA